VDDLHGHVGVRVAIEPSVDEAVRALADDLHEPVAARNDLSDPGHELPDLQPRRGQGKGLADRARNRA
jgi:hypothetical protein